MNDAAFLLSVFGRQHGSEESLVVRNAFSQSLPRKSDPRQGRAIRRERSLTEGRRVDERIEEHRAVAIRQNNAPVLRDRPACGFRQRGHTEVGEFAPLELRGALD